MLYQTTFLSTVIKKNLENQLKEKTRKFTKYEEIKQHTFEYPVKKIINF